MPFYEEIADIYDEMTRFHERLEKESALLEHWHSRYGFRTALDVACGTGLHAIALARQGICTTGVDISDAMLSKARLHAEEAGVDVTWLYASMQQLDSQIPAITFESIFCLGNSLPHLLTPADIETALKNFAALLAPDGILVLQLLNYDRVLAHKERIVGIRRQGEILYVRFYDFHKSTVTFNLLTVYPDTPNCPHHLHSTILYPYQHKELRMYLTQQGFTQIEYYGNMQFQPFESQNSPDLVIVAQK